MPSRRTLLGASGAALTLNFAGWLATPRQAAAAQLAPRALTPEEMGTLSALADTLVPGAREAGLAHYVDQQLGTAISDSLLMIRYVGVEPPFLPFYQSGLAGLEAASKTRYKRAFAELSGPQKDALARTMATENPEGWVGPPAPFVFFVLRADAVDVVYGTPRGFQELGVPYMAHIVPPTPPWRVG